MMDSQSSQSSELHVAFFPFMAHGHMIPTMDMARLFARKGVKATVIITPLNAPFFSKTIERDQQLGFQISVQLINFPSAEAGLPEGCENASSINTPEMESNFAQAVSLLENPLEHILQQLSPDFLVADFFFPWATEVASKFGIPRLVFQGISTFALCVFDSLNRFEPHKSIDTDFESFQIPALPDEIKMTKSQLPIFFKDRNLQQEAHRIFASDLTSYGVLINSFHGLDSAYIEHYRKVMGRKAWQIGPLSLYNKRGDEAEHECLRWLSSKKPESVLYICFGSMISFSAPQLLQIAVALEASGHNFIWVVRNEEKEEDEKWLPEGFEKRMEGKGMIIRGWAPQVRILENEGVGGFMTHCGWNSTLEGVAAGVPMVTWPSRAEQFCNEKLITDVLRIGVGVGAQEWSRHEKKMLIKKEEIEKAVSRVMVGEEAEEIRNRAKALREMARIGVEEGGSSNSDLNCLLDEFKAIKMSK